MTFLDKLTGRDDQLKDANRAEPINEDMRRTERVCILTDNKAEDSEFLYPYYRFTEAGFHVDVATIHGGSFECKNGFGLNSTLRVADLNPNHYALLYIPGGKAPEALRDNDDVITFVRGFAATGKPIAAICHGPQVLVEADLVAGKRIAAWPEIQSEIEEAGAIFVNHSCVEDGQFITARQPGDLPQHLYAALDRLDNYDFGFIGGVIRSGYQVHVGTADIRRM